MAKIVVWQGLQPNKSNPYLLKSFDYFLKCLLGKVFRANLVKSSLEAALQTIYRLIFTLSNTKYFFAQLFNNLHNGAENNKSFSPFIKGFF